MGGIIIKHLSTEWVWLDDTVLSMKGMQLIIESLASMEDALSLTPKTTKINGKHLET